MKTVKRFLRLARVYHAYKKGTLSPSYKPVRLWIEPTNMCNLKCKTCPHGRNEIYFEKGLMDMSLFKKIIQEVSFFGADVNLFMGGESTLHPELTEMIKYMGKKGVASRLYTNATLLTPEKSQELILSGLDHITFSFDGIHKDVYEQYRKGADFENTLYNIRNFLSTKKRLKRKKPFTVIQCLEFKGLNNKPVLKKSFMGLFDRKMVDAFVFIKPHSFGGMRKEYSNNAPGNYSPCAFLWYSMSVMLDGTVVPCCLDVLKRYPLGNVKDKSLEELWNSRKLRDLRWKIHKGKYQEIELCSECDVLWKKRILGIPLKSLYNFIDMIKI